MSATPLFFNSLTGTIASSSALESLLARPKSTTTPFRLTCLVPVELIFPSTLTVDVFKLNDLILLVELSDFKNPSAPATAVQSNVAVINKFTLLISTTASFPVNKLLEVEEFLTSANNNKGGEESSFLFLGVIYLFMKRRN